MKKSKMKIKNLATFQIPRKVKCSVQCFTPQFCFFPSDLKKAGDGLALWLNFLTRSLWNRSKFHRLSSVDKGPLVTCFGFISNDVIKDSCRKWHTTWKGHQI